VLFRSPAGIPGDVTRKHDTTLEPVTIGASAVAHGAPAKLSGGLLAPIAGGDDASDIYGFLARPYPMQGTVNDLGQATTPAGGQGDVMRRGYMAVLLASGTAAKGGQVFVRVTEDTGKAVGDIEAVADPATLAIEGAANQGNAGDATIGTLSVADPAYAGDYAVEMTAATAFNVKDPDGRILGSGSAGTAFSAGGVTFTVTAGGTPCVAGDGFTVTVTESAPGNVAIPATFQGEADTDGNVEIAYNI
jgi:hypothetical protein